jgi:simple sugar transport system permease protein
VTPGVTQHEPGQPSTRGDVAWPGASIAKRILLRPEFAAVAGAIAVWIFFAVTAGDNGFLSKQGTITYIEVASQLAIIAVPVALLMIGGEFDLSIGSMIAAAGVLIALPVVEYGVPLYLALLLAFGAALLIGALNGILVTWTGLPSFIVTLASLFVVRGLTIAVTRDITGTTQVSGLSETLDGTLLHTLLASEINGYPVSVLWAIGIAALGSWVLLRTRFGNWIVAVGGDPGAARNCGVPVRRTKVILFVATALAATLFAAIQVVDTGSADVSRGQLKEFEAIAAAVIGGTLLTGGYGSAVGALFGALIFGMVSQGIFFTGVNTDYFQVFLGATILGAVLINRYFRQRVERAA